MIAIWINGIVCSVREGTTVAAALLNHESAGRRSVTGEPRNALCGMGTCFECRVKIDGKTHRRGCLEICLEGMRIDTE